MKFIFYFLVVNIVTASFWKTKKKINPINVIPKEVGKESNTKSLLKREVRGNLIQRIGEKRMGELFGDNDSFDSIISVPLVKDNDEKIEKIDIVIPDLKELAIFNDDKKFGDYDHEDDGYEDDGYEEGDEEGDRDVISKMDCFIIPSTQKYLTCYQRQLLFIIFFLTIISIFRSIYFS